MVSISIIVPVYKVEIYIEKCIQSLLSQTFNDFEIILVDDRSPDRSIEIAKEMLANQSRIPYQIISKEKNEGLSAARNTGIEKANGKFLLFVDSDDWIEKETLQKLFELATVNDAGMVVFRIRQVYNDDTRPEEIIKSLPPGILTGKEALAKLFSQEFPAHICKILFTKSAFDSTKFPVGIVYEDMLTLPYLLVKEEKVCFIDDVFYNYLQRPGSITRSFDPEIIKVCHRLHTMETDLKPLLNADQRRLLTLYVYMSYLVLCHHAATLSPNYNKAKDLLSVCRKNMKIIELINLLKIRSLRTMFQPFFLKLSTYNFFKKYNDRFHRLNDPLKPAKAI